MRLAIYLLSLILGAFNYLLIGAYMTVSSGFSITVVIGFYCSILIFGVGSWLHFFKPVIGSWLLLVLVLGMFITIPGPLMVQYFIGEDYQPGLLEFLLPLIFSSLIILFLWLGRKTKSPIDKYYYYGSIVPFCMALYYGGYFTIKAFFMSLISAPNL